MTPRLLDDLAEAFSQIAVAYPSNPKRLGNLSPKAAKAARIAARLAGRLKKRQTVYGVAKAYSDRCTALATAWAKGRAARQIIRTTRGSVISDISDTKLAYHDRLRIKSLAGYALRQLADC